MTERSWFWGGISTGDAALPAPYGAPYSDDMFSDVLSMLLQYDRARSGVIYSNRTGFTGNLACTNDHNAVTVGTGVGICDGKLYANDASGTFNFPGDGTYDLVLRKSWAGQTVRIALVSSASVVQTDGVTWDVILYEYVRVGGAVTSALDKRCFIGQPSRQFMPVYDSTPDAGWGTYGAQFRDAQSDALKVRAMIPYDHSGKLKVEILVTSPSGAGNIVYTASGYIQSLSGSLLVFNVPNTTLGVTTGVQTVTLYDETLTTPTNSPRDYRGYPIIFTFQRLGNEVGDDLAQTITAVGGMKITYES